MGTKTIEFRGEEYEVMDNAASNFYVVRSTAFAASGKPSAIFDAYDAVFLGRTDEYAERLNGDFESINELYLEAIGGDGKN